MPFRWDNIEILRPIGRIRGITYHPAEAVQTASLLMWILDRVEGHLLAFARGAVRPAR